LSLRAEEFEILVRLNRWNQQCERLLRVFDENWAIPESQGVVALELFGALKGELESEYRCMNNRRRRPPMTLAERRWYERPIREAHMHLRARPNGPAENWLSSLREAQRALLRAIDALRVESRASPILATKVGAAAGK
jgi:hypothetical protein